MSPGCYLIALCLIYMAIIPILAMRLMGNKTCTIIVSGLWRMNTFLYPKVFTSDPSRTGDFGRF